MTATAPPDAQEAEARRRPPLGQTAMAGPVSASTLAAALGLPSPTPEQRAVIEAPLHSMLVVAGAGSGKTETMASRVVWLAVNGLVEPQAVLGLTFTRKAARELRDRVVRRLGAVRATAGAVVPPEEADPEPDIQTYHAYAASLLAEFGMLAGLEPGA
jgi:DNA helicase II / ATP-dependent DNA helicase PcrA